MEHRAQIMMLPGALNVWVGPLACQRAAQLVWLTTLHWHGVKKTGHLHYNVMKLFSLFTGCVFFCFCCSKENWTTKCAFICSFSKATLTTTPTRRICLSPRSTPASSESSPGSGTSASLYEWSCWAAMSEKLPSHHLTELHLLDPQQRTSREPSVLFAVHFSAERSCWLLGLVFMLIDLFDVAHKLWSIHNLNLNSFGCEQNLHRFCF